MNRVAKRLISLFLSIILCVSLLPNPSAFAQDDEAVEESSIEQSTDNFASVQDSEQALSEADGEHTEELPAAEFDALVSGPFTYQIVDDTAVITGCDTSVKGFLAVPNTIEDKPVTALADRAFDGCTEISGLKLPASLTRIGDGVFTAHGT